ncbi:MAG: citramalate synthase, partial [Nitrospirae bacterium]|nr:citramalate synthase [Nitrospirota bacterium]
EDNLQLIEDSLRHLKAHVHEVFFDAEHFFDGYKANPEFALKCLLTAQDAGADRIIPCDTNGGTLPYDMERIMKKLLPHHSSEGAGIKIPLGIHAHNDAECAVANSIIAVELGAVQVQGTINGLGERCGNANLISIIPNLQIKLGYRCITDEQMSRLRDVSRYINEIANIRQFKRQPFVGDSAFAHKGGIHVSAVRKAPETYEHIRPELVGNSHRILISDLAGRSNIIRKAEELGIHLESDSPQVKVILDEIKELEHDGYEFESADASFELLLRKKLGLHKERLFDSDSIWYKVLIDKEEKKTEPISVAILIVKDKKGRPETVSATGVGPVNALDKALRLAMKQWYPDLYLNIKDVRLNDYKVRVITAGKGTSAKVRVLVESGDDNRSWITVGVSENIIEASWQALVDSIEYKLLKEQGSN